MYNCDIVRRKGRGSAGGWNSLDRRFSKEIKENIESLYGEGHSPSEITALLSVPNPHSVKQYLRMKGLLRSPQEMLLVGLPKTTRRKILEAGLSGSLGWLGEVPWVRSAFEALRNNPDALQWGCGDPSGYYTGNGKTNLNLFSIIDNENAAYWLGFIAADGCLAKDVRQLRIELQERDAEHLQKLANLLNVQLIPTSKKTPRGEDRRYVLLAVSSRAMAFDLATKGIVPNKTKEGIGEAVWQAVPLGLLRHFVRGIVDGDGCIYISHGRKSHRKDGSPSKPYTFVTVTVVGHPDFIVKLNQKAGEAIGVAFGDPTPTAGSLTARWSGNDALRLLDWLYDGATVYLERKHEKYLEAKTAYEQRAVA